MFFFFCLHYYCRCECKFTNLCPTNLLWSNFMSLHKFLLLLISKGVFVCHWGIKVWRIITKSKQAKLALASQLRKEGRTQVFDLAG